MKSLNLGLKAFYGRLVRWHPNHWTWVDEVHEPKVRVSGLAFGRASGSGTIDTGRLAMLLCGSE